MSRPPAFRIESQARWARLHAANTSHQPRVTWKRNAPEFVEYRFVLQIASRRMRLTGRPQRLAGIDDATPEQQPLARPPQPTAAPDVTPNPAPSAAPTIRARAKSVKKRVLKRVRGWLG